VLAGTDWSNLTVAGAFVVGACLATIAYLRLTRHMLGMFGRERGRKTGTDDDVTPP
jgi:hypothetical protein